MPGEDATDVASRPSGVAGSAQTGAEKDKESESGGEKGDAQGLDARRAALGRLSVDKKGSNPHAMFSPFFSRTVGARLMV